MAAKAKENSLARIISMVARKHGSGSLNNTGLSDEEYTKRFLDAFNHAAQELGYASYDALPQGVKDSIGQIGGRGSAQMTREIDTVGPAVEEEVAPPPPPRPPPAPFPLTQTPWFRQKALAHNSWWGLELNEPGKW